MFWRESKCQDFWVAVLKMFNAKAIVDFTPGSGTLASAAMSLGAFFRSLSFCSHPYCSK